MTGVQANSKLGSYIPSAVRAGQSLRRLVQSLKFRFPKDLNILGSFTAPHTFEMFLALVPDLRWRRKMIGVHWAKPLPAMPWGHPTVLGSFIALFFNSPNPAVLNAVFLLSFFAELSICEDIKT